MEVVVE